MAMQVEHKTEKGTVIFYLPPIGANRFKFFNDEAPYLSYFICSETFRKRFQKGTVLIGLTSEITEEQANIMVDDEYDYGFNTGFVDYTNKATVCGLSALDSFKSLMQHLQVYEVNPYKQNPCEGCDDYEVYTEIQPRVGKWIVLFKTEI